MAKKYRKNKWKGKYHKGSNPKYNKKSVKERRRLRLLSQDRLLNEYFYQQQKRNQ